MEEIDRSDGHMKLCMLNNEDKKLIISFGSFKLRTETFLFKAAFDRLRLNCLYLNSDKDNWYTEGLTHLDSRSAEHSAKALQRIITKLIKEHNLKKVIFIGQSMGGYGVLLWSKYIELPVPTDFISFCAKVDLSNRSVSKHYKCSSENQSEGNLYSLAESVSKKINQNTRYLYMYGERDLLDASCALNFKKQFSGVDEFHILSYLDSDHYLPRGLSEIGLDDTLNKLINFDKNIIGLGGLHNFLTEDDLASLRAIESSTDLNSEYIKTLFRLLEKYPKFFLALNRIGVAYAEKRDRHKAIEFLKKAYRLSPRDINTNSHLASIYKSIGKYGAAMMHAANIYRLEGSDSNLNRIKELHKLIIENHSDELLAKKIQQ